MTKINPIAFVKSPYKEKFAVPRQPGLVKNCFGSIEFNTEFNSADIFDGLDTFSHLWLIFQFHQTADQDWNNSVRPPRLGGNQKVGVFASRSPFRPNSLGLSVVKLEAIHTEQTPFKLAISQLDLVDGTPIFDIKPYVPYADAIHDAEGGFAVSAPEKALRTEFSIEAENVISQYKAQFPHLRDFITEVLAQDPRPAYHKNKPQDREYGAKLEIFNVRWRVIDNCNQVFSIDELPN